jgi:hypothetical protein
MDAKDASVQSRRNFDRLADKILQNEAFYNHVISNMQETFQQDKNLASHRSKGYEGPKSTISEEILYFKNMLDKGITGNMTTDFTKLVPSIVTSMATLNGNFHNDGKSLAKSISNSIAAADNFTLMTTKNELGIDVLKNILHENLFAELEARFAKGKKFSEMTQDQGQSLLDIIKRHEGSSLVKYDKVRDGGDREKIKEMEDSIFATTSIKKIAQEAANPNPNKAPTNEQQEMKNQVDTLTKAGFSFSKENLSPLEKIKEVKVFREAFQEKRNELATLSSFYAETLNLTKGLHNEVDIERSKEQYLKRRGKQNGRRFTSADIVIKNTLTAEKQPREPNIKWRPIDERPTKHEPKHGGSASSSTDERPTKHETKRGGSASSSTNEEPIRLTDTDRNRIELKRENAVKKSPITHETRVRSDSETKPVFHNTNKILGDLERATRDVKPTEVPKELKDTMADIIKQAEDLKPKSMQRSESGEIKEKPSHEPGKNPTHADRVGGPKKQNPSPDNTPPTTPRGDRGIS